MKREPSGRLAEFIRRYREERQISRRQLADETGVNVSVVSRAERGADFKISTAERLFRGLGYELCWHATELAEEIPDLLLEEAERRRERQLEGLCAVLRRR